MKKFSPSKKSMGIATSANKQGKRKGKKERKKGAANQKTAENPGILKHRGKEVGRGSKSEAESLI